MGFQNNKLTSDIK